MATTTTNNGWTIPQSTDLVTNGATAIAALGNGIDTSVGTGLKAWTTYTPTLSSGWLNGNGTWAAYYSVTGKILTISAKFTVGSTTTKGTGFVVNLPGSYTFKDYLRVSGAGFGMTAALTDYTFQIKGASSTTFEVLCIAANGTYARGNQIVGASAPGVWATNDYVVYTFTAEVA